MNKFLIAGLGNPGETYAHTRHNIGFDILDRFVAKHGGQFTSERLADRAEIRIKGRLLICIKPSTFMNLSGKAVRYWLDREKISTESLLVVTDDIALPMEKLRLKPAGSDGGHNGLKDIQEMLGTTEYPRLKFGIGNNFPRGGQSTYVLSRWLPEETPLVDRKIEKSTEIIENFVLEGIDRTMNRVNNLNFLN
jgi:PTH1 family peptidyl-tRNA hydrolase